MEDLDKRIDEIMAAATQAEIWLSDFPLGRDGKPIYMNDEPEQAEMRKALIAASELLKQVEELQTSWASYKADMRPETRNNFLRMASKTFDKEST